MNYPEHIQHAINQYENRLIQTIRAEGLELNINQAVKIFIDADPTPGKNLVDWMIRAYCDQGFRWEDIEIGVESKVSNTLALYREHYKKLPVEQRNIYDYKELGKIYAAIQKFIVTEQDNCLSGKELKRREKEQVLEETIVVHRSDQMIVAVPLTEKAGKWWGRGTQWCTAADRNNYFDRYNKTAPLIVITLLNSDRSDKSSIGNADQSVIKLQLHITKNEIQSEAQLSFMDETDSTVTQEFIYKHWKKLKFIVEWMLDSNGLALKYFPQNLITPEIARLAVEKNGSALIYVPYYLRTTKICWAAVETGEMALNFVPARIETPELNRLAIIKNGESLAHIRIKARTAEICRLAVEQSGSALCYVPDNVITSEICMCAVQQNGLSIIYVPESLLTLEICKIAVKQNGLALRYIQAKYLISEICNLAIERKGTALTYVPLELKTPELCMIAVKQEGAALPYVPLDKRTNDMHRIALEQHGMALEYIPIDMITAQLCKIAVEQTGKAIKFVPDEMKTSELIEISQHKIINEREWSISDLDGLKNLLDQSVSVKEDQVRVP